MQTDQDGAVQRKITKCMFVLCWITFLIRVKAQITNSSFFLQHANEPAKSKALVGVWAALLQKVNMGLSLTQHCVKERSFFLLRVRQR